MAAPYFGSYTLSASGYSNGGIKTDLTAMLATLAALLPLEGDNTKGTTSPDFDRLDAHTGALLRGEIARMQAVVAAAT